MFIRVKQIIRDDKDKILNTFVNFVAKDDIRRISITNELIDPVNKIFSCELEFKANQNIDKKGELLDNWIEIGSNEEKLTELLK
mgnify:CR=1 FL=1